ncbi:hypothetical protein [Janthinobacterium sp. B9-8]|uniref:hypothetical protein n=1 Tax=Janthinobacterium sp. B9-8 TaxID=1236179 RepID=UPI00061CE6A5|nr:hypothetical protein [Janthinobacterium sp. B9-8]AMC33482.1 hypothetical protein VN23_02135 [Janthinobacterium sp. B9-8]
MNRYSIILLSALCTANVAVIAAPSVLLPPVSGEAVQVNGKTYFKQGNTASAPAASLASEPQIIRRMAAEPEAGLYAGDVLGSAQERLPATVSGAVLLQLKNAVDEQALVSQYGLSVKFRTQSVLLLQAAPGAELLQLLAQLQADQRVSRAELELVRNKALTQ